MKNKQVGILILTLAVLFFFIALSFNNALESIVTTSCTHGIECPMHTTLATQKTLSYGLIGIIIAIGLAITFFMKEGKEKKERTAKNTEGHKLTNNHTLNNEEKTIIQLLKTHEGSQYQSDIIKESKLSKVKVSRTLDKLEGKGLVTRQRRGMTNIVILNGN